MSKGDKKLIDVLLIIIAIASILLLIKIKMRPDYDPEAYARIYSEYESIKQQVNENNEETENNNEEIEYNTNENDNSEFNNSQENIISSENNTTNNTANSNRNVVYKTVNSGNKTYTVDGEIMIPKLKIVYPVINEKSEEYLKIAPIKLTGPNMNEVGNYCIAGHNYKNDQFFSKLSQLEINDSVKLTSNNGRKVTYWVYDMYEVNENDLSCTNQNTNGKVETTLITCTTQKQNRLIVKCRAVT